jgi:CRP-like cAMP-binding protein
LSGSTDLDILDFLAATVLFAGLGFQQLALIAARLRPLLLRRNALLFRQGEPSRGLYLVQRGHVATVAGYGDREMVILVESAGAAVGEAALVDAQPQFASARALDPARVLLLPTEDLPASYAAVPELRERIACDVALRLRRIAERYVTFGTADAYTRTALVLADYARAAGPLVDGLRFRLPTTRTQLSHEINLRRETLARVLGELRRRNVLYVDGRDVEIIDARALVAQAHE